MTTNDTSGRGPHRDDARDLGPRAWPSLRQATRDLNWLLSRGYAEVAANTLVGDRFQLSKRQRTAVLRSSCSDAALQDRRARQVHDLAGLPVHIDGFNVLIPVERSLAGGPLVRGADGAFRDLGGVHGTWRSVRHTPTAIEIIGRTLTAASEVTWWLDRPVSNSGRLAQVVRNVAEAQGWSWTVALEDRVDPVLAGQSGVVATSDGWILDQGVRWIDLIGPVVRASVRSPWIVDLGADSAD